MFFFCCMVASCFTLAVPPSTAMLWVERALVSRDRQWQIDVRAADSSIAWKGALAACERSSVE